MKFQYATWLSFALSLQGTLAQSTQYPSLTEATLDELAAGLESGSWTSVDLVKAYIARIQEVNGALHAVTQINPDALDIAAQTDELRKQGTVLGPLHGIPILIKNNIATLDLMDNTAGSYALVGAKVPRDSTIAAKLRQAGAVILGKTNLSQWANWRSHNTSNGWSATAGQTYGAYYPEQDPSGSSSGSAVASSIGLALASLGTETSGSILAPADVNNCVAIKPTVGLTSRYLVIPISEHHDTVGPIARTVKDAAYLLQAIAGPDSNDNYTSNAFENGCPDYVAACNANSLAGVRIGVARNVLDLWGKYVDQLMLDAFDQAVEQIKNAGAILVDANFTGFEAFQDDGNQTLVLNADFNTNLPAYLSQLTNNPNDIRDLTDLLNFTQNSQYEDYPERDTLVWEAGLNQSWGNTDPRFWQALLSMQYYGAEGGVLGALERTNTQAILLPTELSPVIPAIAGSPVVTVPMGFYPSQYNTTRNGFGNLNFVGPNLPFGLSFMGAKFSEAELIGFAYAYEQLTHHRTEVQPYIVPKTELADVVESK
ncbi:uncharacterized protein MYCGRDRAFT_41422 [Zymoseptoria tritici IPO323]|uniref:Amidase domain-containing protein n=1 Tax=Zymoseptoria tritici (strain CBS 115943 / IPO323) TaxID=336722 RepID=F9XB92_ZYMTI|nr:uncharacterized protein MYCGRDRAFT_41422 [Zymoseptoria tritici IPO323]EGP87078.1 hypothetical protein MYCGRDRAFT_41422 [Zymoseptoria tritici IPO323]